MFPGIFDFGRFIIARRTAHGARRTAETFGQTAFAAFVIILASFCTLAFADKAAAQNPPPSSISYTTEPAGLITITADGEVIVLSQPNAGAMTVTISGVGFTLVGGEYVRTGYTGQDTLTLRFLTSCSVGGGCDAFGLESANPDERRARTERTQAFRNMSLTTLSMFIASGADVNENVGTTADSYLLYQTADARNTAQFSLLVEAGADVNATAAGFSLLHYAAFIGNNHAADLLLSADGIEVNKVINGRTPLDAAAAFHIIGLDRAPVAAAIREAGGVCMLAAHIGNPAAEP
ncbi:MAG: ankyrin repeat domain-containing protein, partial [Gammaproteobacteria bacterium]